MWARVPVRYRVANRSGRCRVQREARTRLGRATHLPPPPTNANAGCTESTEGGTSQTGAELLPLHLRSQTLNPCTDESFTGDDVGSIRFETCSKKHEETPQPGLRNRLRLWLHCFWALGAAQRTFRSCCI
ncbi:hypothetical protein NDU88_003243 [Pleurodeles waltl]|uniref:Uncharacterized protein n=1 Tax=Pleurodeles waltl TaxID=8319 RepID=A0AAV7W2Y7_PLEWA|nr:hypothetical protein NDU88_003243 [Pleurodeles waltl]